MLDVKEREKAGLIPSASLRESAAWPMTKHLEDYLSELRVVGRDDMYIKNLGYRLNILIRECRWTYPAKVTADSFTDWRAKQRKAAKTHNQYLDSANVLLNSMIKKKRLSENPLAGVEKVEFQPAFERRAYCDDEVKRLLEVA